MIDEYWFGEVSRISPEAPVPVVKLERKEDRAGAAGNVYMNCRSMGAKAELLSSESPEITKIRVIGKNQQIVRIDNDLYQAPISIPLFEKFCDGKDIVIFSDYGKGTLSNIHQLIPIAQKYQCKILVDPKGHNYSKYAGAYLVKPNRDEMKEMIGGWGSEDELTTKVSALMEKSGIENVLLTLASDGMMLFTRHGMSHIHSVAKEVYDVSGAGDTAIAAVAVCLDLGYDLETSVMYANKAAGIAVGRFGTTTVEARELFNDFG